MAELDVVCLLRFSGGGLCLSVGLYILVRVCVYILSANLARGMCTNINR